MMPDAAQLLRIEDHLINTDKNVSDLARQIAPLTGMPTQITHIEKMVERMQDEAMGDGTDDNPGTRIRLDRLEQQAKNWSRIASIAVGAALTSLVGAAFALLKGHP